MQSEATVIGQIYPSNAFTYVKSGKLFVAEITEMSGVLRQLWHDSMDLGFGMRSVKTGRVIYFTLDSRLYDAEREMIGWAFKVYNPTNAPELQGLTVHVLND